MELPELEQRLSNLQLQVEGLWRKAESNVPPIEQRLAAMADQYAEHLKRWASTVERHTHAVAQLEAYASEWKDASTRVRQETADRLQELETTIEREWDTLKRMQEEPIRELREQATTLQQASLAMSNASLAGVERAEARFASFENDVHMRLAELTRDLQSALLEMKLRLDRPPGRDPAAPWSLDDVTRLHGQLRDGTRLGGDLTQTIEHPSLRELSAAVAPETGSAGTLAGIPLKWAAAVIVLGLAAVVAMFFGWELRGQVKTATERAKISELKADAAVSDAARQTAAARQEASKQLAEMREMTMRAQRMAEVAAAPDLIRFNLAGAGGASGQGLFSRSRGLVVNGWRLPQPAGNTTYQAWLVTQTTPVKAGTLTPQPDGSATLVQQMPAVPRRVVGIIVSAETLAEGEAPSGPTVLSSTAPGNTAPASSEPSSAPIVREEQ